MKTFEQKTVEVIKQIPYGRVMSYGQVAACAGSPRSAIIVGQILRHSTSTYNLPWQRVINSKGIISIINMEFAQELQAQLLESEGIEIEHRGDRYYIDLSRYGWIPEIKNGKIL